MCHIAVNSYGRGPEFEGAVIAMFHLLLTKGDKVRFCHFSLC